MVDKKKMKLQFRIENMTDEEIDERIDHFFKYESDGLNVENNEFIRTLLCVQNARDTERRNQFVLKNKKTNKILTMKDIFKMGEV